MDQYTIKMENFEGPLDLLCHLIDKNKMDICDIKICEITDQYLAYLNEMQQMNLDVTSEFIVMASRLIYLKSKSLLPTVVEDDEEEIDLVQMLLEYKKYKEYTKTLKERIEVYGGKFYKLPDKIELPKGKLEGTFEKDLIPNIYADFVNKEIAKKNLRADNINRLATSEKYTINVVDSFSLKTESYTSTAQFEIIVYKTLGDSRPTNYTLNLLKSLSVSTNTTDS